MVMGDKEDGTCVVEEQELELELGQVEKFLELLQESRPLQQTSKNS